MKEEEGRISSEIRHYHMILIVSFENNEHVNAVRAHLTHESVVVDTAWFPKGLSLRARLSDAKECLRVTLPSGQVVDLGKIRSVWYRRIKPYTFHDELVDETARLFAWSEANESLMGVWYSLNCFWMNPPTADEVALRKIKQLQVARHVGLSIPETLVTNDAAAARAFIAQHGPESVIRKAFRNIAQAPRETIVLNEADLELIDSVKYTPVILQRYVPADLDLRVTVVEDDIFAAAVRSRPEYHADYRTGLGSAEVTPYQLPADVAERLLALMKTFDLKYGAVDFRVTPEGEHVFLEVNPAGEYLFISHRTGQPIPAAIAAALERHDRQAA
jgi:hypothetical protein